MGQKADAVSTEDLLKSAKAGDAPAQYFYWKRQFDQAQENTSRAFGQMMDAAHALNTEQSKAADAKWKTADEADRNKAAAAGDIGAEMVARQLEHDKLIEEAIKDSEWLMKSAEQGFPPAEFDAAMNYLRQFGWQVIEIDEPKGLELLQRAADHGWASGEYRLALAYLAGEWLPPDPVKALEYMRKAADKGGPQSNYKLAQLYAQGIGEPRSDADSPVALLRRSAAKGYNMAFIALAERYRTGLGMPLDYIQAVRYYQAGREAGEMPFHAANIRNLVDENLQAKPDVGPNWTGFANVLSVYLRATQREDASAMNQLGDWCLKGQFMPRNPVAAYYWFDRAAQGGAATAAQKRAELKAKLRPDELEQAGKLYETMP
jgi:TPR repeat protein